MFNVTKCDLNALDTDGNTPLHIACKHGQEDTVSYLVKEGKCNANIPNETGYYTLHIACQISLAIVTRLLHAKCDINCQDADGNTALHIACYNQSYDIIEHLLKDEMCRADISNRFGDLPLHSIVKYCYYNSRMQIENQKSDTDYYRSIPLSRLLEREAVNDIRRQVEKMTKYRSSHYYTTMCTWTNRISTSELERKLQVIGMLINKNSLAITTANKAGITPIHFAIMSGDVDVLDLFLNGTQFTETITPFLHFACKYQQPQCVRWLIDHGADNQVADSRGDYPEHLCTINNTHNGNDTGCIETLSVLGTIDLLKKNDVGNTVLHLVCRSGYDHTLQYILSTCDCSDALTISNEYKDTPLHILASRITRESLKKLIAKCKPSDPNVKDWYGNTPLHIACKNSNVNFAKLMIELRCDPNICNDQGELPIHIAAAKSLELVKLVSRSDNVNAQSNSGNTPLHMACREGNVKAVCFLVETLKCSTNVVNENSGLTPLHYACAWNIMKVVSLVSDCDPTAKIISINDANFRMHGVTFSLGDTPLHVACKAGNVKIIKYLLKAHKSALNISNDLGELPFHIACNGYSEKIARPFINYKQYFNCSSKNQCGNTPLHIACDKGHAVSFINSMVNHLKCRTDIVNKDSNLPLHIACQNSSVCLASVKALSARLSKDKLSTQNSKGNTAFHELLRQSNVKKSVQFLANKMDQVDLAKSNEDDEMPIHLACRQQELDVVKDLYEKCKSSISEPNLLMYEAGLNDNPGVLEYIINSLHLDPNLPNKDGDLPLHIVVRTKRRNYEKNAILLIAKTNNVNFTNSHEGNTPLHELYHYTSRFSGSDRSDSRVLSTLLDKADIDLAVQNLKGQTVLHCICIARRYDDLKLIISQKKPNVNTQDNEGSTALHIVCQAGHFESVHLLLSSAEADPSIKGKFGRTPIAYTKDPEIIKLLFEYGADPKPLYTMFFETVSNPPPTPVKLLVIGDPSVGKTTIVQSLRNEKSENIIITDGFDHTAGVVTTTFSSEIYGDVKFYDFAGQPEYYTSHDTVLHSTIKNVPPIVLILVNLTDTKKKIRNRVHYWVNFIENRCAAVNDAAHVIIVYSHADVLASQGEDPLQKLKKVILPDFEDKQLILKEILLINCKLSHSNEMNKLRETLKRSTNELREEGIMHFTCHCLYVLLLRTFKDSSTVPLGHVISKVRLLSKDKRDNPLFLLPTNRENIIQMCKELNDKGHIMFIEHPLDTDMSWIMFDTQPLLHDLLGTLFAPSSFPQHQPLSYSTGVIPLSHFEKYLDEHYSYAPNMMLTFLTRLEYCREITDKVLLDSIVKQEGYSETERYYFFPNLVSRDRPDDKWSTGSKYYQCGWLVQCKKEGDFFSPHFIQVLLLRLTFAFAPKKVAYDSKDIEDSEDESEEEENQAMSLVIKRTCSVWKNGLYWKQSGMKTIIDIIDQRTLTLLMQCHHGRELQLLRRRSMIMSMVLNAKKEFSSKSQIIEYFLHPECVKHPLKSISKCRLFSLPQIEQSIINRDPCVANNVDDEIDLQQLLLFEPYFELGTDIIKKLSNEANFHETANNDLLSLIARDIDRKHYSFFVSFSRTLGIRATDAVNESHQLANILKQILTRRKHTGATRRDLHEFFNQMSIFYGRHPPQGRQYSIATFIV
jgi:ankyrin repeat protein/GTPase SAR1 family protein